MIEDLLRETLRDPDRALTPWNDPVARVRRAARAERRRRLTLAVAAVTALAGVLAVPRLTPDRRTAPPVSTPTPSVSTPTAPVARLLAVHFLDGDLGAVVAGDGAVWVVSGSRVMEVAPETGRVRREEKRTVPPSRMVEVGGEVEVVDGASLHGVFGAVRGGIGFTRRIDDVVSDGERAWAAHGDVVQIAGEGRATPRLPGAGPTRLAYADGALWARRQGEGGVILVRISPETMRVTGTVTVPGGPRDAAFAAGGGRVYLVTASVLAGELTVGGIVAVDAATLVAGEPVPGPFAKKLVHHDGSLWLLTGTGSLHRLDGRALQPLGNPVDTGSAADFAIRDRTIWVTGKRLLRYEITG